MLYVIIICLTGMLEQGKLDIAPAEFTITQARSTAADFLPTIAESYQQIFLKNPSDALHWKAYTDPFTPFCWVGIILFIAVLPPIVAGIMFYGNAINIDTAMSIIQLALMLNCHHINTFLILSFINTK